jgi:hypothetical protein
VQGPPGSVRRIADHDRRARTPAVADRMGSRRIEQPADAAHEHPRVTLRDAANGVLEAMVNFGAVPVEVGSAVDE